MKKVGKFLRCSLVLLCLAALIACDPELAIDDGTGVIVGKVVFSNDTTHEGIVVSLESRERTITRSVKAVLSGEASTTASRALQDQTTTDTEGAYQFDRVPQGAIRYMHPLPILRRKPSLRPWKSRETGESPFPNCI